MKVNRLTARYLRRAAWFALACALAACGGWFALPLVPPPPALFVEEIPQLELLDRSGQPLRAVRPDAGPFRKATRYAEIPQALIEATLAAEDRRFWRHPGVDWRATARAAWQWARHRRVVSGGSTITQQLIKLAEPRPRNLWSKLLEAVQALRLEQVWDKQQILAAYLNRLDYGNLNRGCAAAAEFYFAKPLRDLSPAECALLAALPQAPTRLNPHTNFPRAIKRQRWVLGQMRDLGWIAPEEWQRALQEPLHLAPPRRRFAAPHFVDLLLNDLQQEALDDPQGLGAHHLAGALRDAPARGKVPSGQRIPERWREAATSTLHTTLDLDLNRFAENALRQHLSRLRAQHVSDGAVVVLDNRSGDVLALVGSADYFAPDAGQVNGAWAPRSPGSTIKPFTYLLALERGATPATVVADVPTEFATATGLFAPVNYDRHCYGPMRYRLALANSLNISAVKVLASIGGPEPLKHLLQECGLSTLGQPAEDYGLGFTIGNAEARLLELANAYACLARLGENKPWRLVHDVREQWRSADRVGDIQSGRRVADASACYLIADILSDNDARALAFGAESPLRFDFPVACKTGTSSDFRDNWAFGYTPEFTVGVWVGNFNGSPMQHVSGVTGAAPLLHEVIDHLHQQFGTSWYVTPRNVVECLVHRVTGKRLLGQTSGGRETDAVMEKFISRHLPPFENEKDHGAESANGKRTLRLGGEYRDWLASGDNWLGHRAVAGFEQQVPRILFPPPGTVVYLDPDLPHQGCRVVLRGAGGANLKWECDSLRLLEEGGKQVALLTEGRHRLSLRDPVSGAQADSWFEVLAR